jgi:hypothetical protein
LTGFPIRVLPVDGSAGPQRQVDDVDAEQIRIAVRGRIADGIAIREAVTKGTYDAWLDSQPRSDKAAVKAWVCALAATVGGR